MSMGQKGVKVRIGPRGQVKMEAYGYKGAACLQATKDVMEKLGATEDDVEHTGDMYQSDVENELDNPLGG